MLRETPPAPSITSLVLMEAIFFPGHFNYHTPCFAIRIVLLCIINLRRRQMEAQGTGVNTLLQELESRSVQPPSVTCATDVALYPLQDHMLFT